MVPTGRWQEAEIRAVRWPRQLVPPSETTVVPIKYRIVMVLRLRAAMSLEELQDAHQHAAKLRIPVFGQTGLGFRMLAR